MRPESLIADTQKSKAGTEADTTKLTNELEHTNSQVLALKRDRDQLSIQLEKTITTSQRSQQEFNDLKHQLESQLAAKTTALAAAKEEHEEVKRTAEKAKADIRELEAAKDLAHNNLERTKDAEISSLKNEHSIALTKQIEEHTKQKEQELEITYCNACRSSTKTNRQFYD